MSNRLDEETAAHLVVERACKHFGNTVALDNVSLTVPRGSLVCLLGPSGCGKTTLLRAIAGFERLDSGHIKIAGQDVTPLPAAQRRFGMVFQSYALFPHLTVHENVAYGLRGKRIRGKEREKKVRELLDLVGLRHHEKRYPSQLSGGEQQRVALARALMLSPDILLLDEPLSALDTKVRGRLRTELRSLQQRLGITTLLVTHDQEEALTLADVLAVMREGRIEQVGSPREVYERPASLFVADFVGSVNLFKAKDLLGLFQATGQNCGDLGDAEIVAVRPEHIRVARQTGIQTRERKTVPRARAAGSPRREVVIPATVQHVEFCGAHFRLTAQSCWNGPQSRHTITALLPANAGSLNDLEAGAGVWLRIPHDRMLCYRR